MTEREQQFIRILDKQSASMVDPGDIHQIASTICDALREHGIEVEIEGAYVGPQATQYTTYCHMDDKNLRDLIPSIKDYLEQKFVKQIRIIIVSTEQARQLKIKAPKDTICVLIEVPNKHRIICGLRNVLKSDEWKTAIEDFPLAFVAGVNLSGENVIKNLGHIKGMLLTGDTRSGKTMFLHSMIASLISHNSPDDLKFIIMDTIGVNYTEYENNPYLAKPVITDANEILDCLKWIDEEQDRRYSLMVERKVKSISEYNKHCDDSEKIPNLVVIIDEIAYIMRNRKLSTEFEARIVRICQRNRASGVYLVLSTQQTIKEVVTGLIKTNLASHVAFYMHSAEQSLIAIDQLGAESLTRFGDMLFCSPEMLGYAERLQGVYLNDNEIKRIADFLR